MRPYCRHTGSSFLRRSFSPPPRCWGRRVLAPDSIGVHLHCKCTGSSFSRRPFCPPPLSCGRRVRAGCRLRGILTLAICILRFDLRVRRALCSSVVTWSLAAASSSRSCFSWPFLSWSRRVLAPDSVGVHLCSSVVMWSSAAPVEAEPRFDNGRRRLQPCLPFRAFFRKIAAP
jgi:hypothetical protein